MINKVIVRGYKSKGAGSKFITWFTRGEYSHVSLIFVFTDGHREEIESVQFKGVITHSPINSGCYCELLLPLDDEQMQCCYLEARYLIGSNYDWIGVFNFLRRRKKHSAINWFCSEGVSYCAWKAKRPLSRREPWRETPSSVMESLVLVDEAKLDI